MTKRIITGGPQVKATVRATSRSIFSNRVVTTPTGPLHSGSGVSTVWRKVMSARVLHSCSRGL